MKYKTTDGEVIEGASPLDIATALRDGSRFASDQSLFSFMRGMAQRSREWDNSIVRTDAPENFIADLVTSGFLTEVN